ncbi:Tumor Necrosis Factor Alpha-Induced Protein 3 [Manis pentadactyla]|nr:Tumor Necrosis Factor Alpha-Induced Protein 3 [Manis pentadactyla]
MVELEYEGEYELLWRSRGLSPGLPFSVTLLLLGSCEQTHGLRNLGPWASLGSFHPRGSCVSGLGGLKPLAAAGSSRMLPWAQDTAELPAEGQLAERRTLSQRL